MGINVGAMLGGILCGWIGQQYNWHLGFGIAGIFMILGLVVFVKNQSILGPIGLPPYEAILRAKTKLGISMSRNGQRLVYMGTGVWPMSVETIALASIIPWQSDTSCFDSDRCLVKSLAPHPSLSLR